MTGTEAWFFTAIDKDWTNGSVFNCYEQMNEGIFDCTAERGNLKMINAETARMNGNNQGVRWLEQKLCPTRRYRVITWVLKLQCLVQYIASLLSSPNFSPTVFLSFHFSFYLRLLHPSTFPPVPAGTSPMYLVSFCTTLRLPHHLPLLPSHAMLTCCACHARHTHCVRYIDICGLNIIAHHISQTSLRI